MVGFKVFYGFPAVRNWYHNLVTVELVTVELVTVGLVTVELVTVGLVTVESRVAALNLLLTKSGSNRSQGNIV